MMTPRLGLPLPETLTVSLSSPLCRDNGSANDDRAAVIIHAAAGWNLQASKAIIEGLGQRRRETQRAVHFFGISGVTNIADRPLTVGRIETNTLSDEDDIYSYMKTRQFEEEYMPRAADIAVVEGGLEHDVETHIVMAPHIFGVGTGSFNRFTFPVNMMMKGAKSIGKGFVIGEGTAVWSRIHVEDLAELYIVLLKAVLDGKSIPSGKKGVYFAESGSAPHLEMSTKIAKAGKELGLLPSAEVEHVDLETGAKLFGGWGPSMAEAGGASK
jgi:nucleoside-diphosphate-sugar epimerase